LIRIKQPLKSDIFSSKTCRFHHFGKAKPHKKERRKKHTQGKNDPEEQAFWQIFGLVFEKRYFRELRILVQKRSKKKSQPDNKNN